MITKERLQVAIRQRKGFTLIEILIVVAIIAILASVVLVGLGPTQSAGRDARRLSDLREVQTGLELYYNVCGFYPGGAQPDIPCTAWSDQAGWANLTTALTGTPTIQVNSVPNDPSGGSATYYYDSGDEGQTYIIAAKLENPGNSAFTNYTAPSVEELQIQNLGVTCESSSTQGTSAGDVYCLSL